MIVSCPGRGAAFFMPLRRAGTITDTGARYGPGSAAHHAAKCYALRCVRGTQASHHHTEPLRRPRDAGVEPPCPAVLKRKAFVEQHHVVPLRALTLVHGKYVAVVEFVVRFALLPRHR